MVSQKPLKNHSPKAPRNTRIALVVSQYNPEISKALEASCIAELLRCGISKNNLHVSAVPGAFELPFACQKIAQTHQFQAIIALGAVIRGETPHFDVIVENASRGIMEVGLKTNTPVIFGVLTTNTVAQAKARIQGGKEGDKGIEFARSALQMVHFKEQESQ